MKYLMLLVAAFVLAACSGQSYDTELAKESRWKALGIKDGENGRLVRTKDELNQLTPLKEDAYELYQLGYREGIEDYCLPYKTYKQGKKGAQYTGQCLNTSHERLAIEGWEAGYKEYVADQDNQWLNRD
ncbi:DUF2799 domain-containing protein [Photobacterium ganghwense]|uniref:DUF2799 domain-containing protein n=1 Tax=Photobacterium ganghwense TaxID=320778 RepID=UPI00069D1C96|nr:DUF2799 domain-containing protein [Photobacterium ganghwense]MBV1839339.1 DUF2799 domain-containing protein [Photobacterium ganghwense]PSU09228.1 DUF2799 domain-containing protein [Photobacterium ganghwense]QSV16419.1 DUF2799 domain-containing protein [Photobacterium ganghwense]